MSIDSELPTPELRATVADSGLLMTMWGPHLLYRGGPTGSLMALLDSAGIYDLSIRRETHDGLTTATELIVTDVIPRRRDAARQTLTAWATSLSYCRIWFDDEVIPLEGGLALAGSWEASCSGCGAKWSDDSTEFWLYTRGAGRYPFTCQLCGHPLPQPTPIGHAMTGRSTTAVTAPLGPDRQTTESV